jgi:hypothetical protein
MIRDALIKISELMTTAFGLVAALAWNQAIQSLFKGGGHFILYQSMEFGYMRLR